MAIKAPSMQSLQALEAFARLGSVWRAADELGITRSAVSHRISLLEELLGFEVLERSGKGAALTLRGRRYALQVGRSLTLLTDAGNEGSAPIAGTLKISSTAGFASMWLCHGIARFHEEHPDLRIEIATRRVLDEISDPSVDIFIAFGDGNWPNYVIHPLYDVEFLPVCSPSLLNRRGGMEQPADLLRYPLLHLLGPEDWSRWFAMHGVELAGSIPGIVFSNMMLVQSAAIAGQGVMMGDNVTYAALLATGQLVRPFSMTISASGSYYLVFPKRHRANPAVLAFTSWLKALINELRSESHTP